MLHPRTEAICALVHWALSAQVTSGTMVIDSRSLYFDEFLQQHYTRYGRGGSKKTQMDGHQDVKLRARPSLKEGAGVTQGSHNPLPHAFACPATTCNRPSNRQ